VAHETAAKEFGESLVECVRQGLDETSLLHVDIDYREITVELQAVEVSALRSHDSTSVSSTILLGQPGSIDRLQALSNGQ
jgi:hypothetical protein